MKVNPWARRQARRALVQAVYQWQMSGADMSPVLKEYLGGQSLKKADKPFFEEAFRGVTSRVDRTLGDAALLDEPLDKDIAPLLDRKLSDLDQVERAILRLGAWELRYRIEIPYRVVLDEYVELAKTFGAEESHKYINAVLDGLAHSLRPVEVAAHAPPAGSGGPG
jgi:N utilization substance protein B